MWEEKKLGDVIKLEYGKPLPENKRKEDGVYPAYGANGVKCKTDEYYYDKASIIVGRKGSAGEITLTESRFWPLDVTYFVTFDERKYNLLFLFYCLKNLKIQKLAKGVKPGINRNDVYALKLLFPPLSEQERIVAILDEAFEEIDTAVANTEKNLANARELFESYLNNVFTQKGDGWEEKSIKDIADVKGGKRVPKGYKLLSETTDYPYISVKDFSDSGTVTNETVRFVSKEIYEHIRRYTISSDDLYISIAGTIGKSGIIPKNLDGANLTENACKLVFGSKTFNRFVYYITLSQSFKDQTLSRTRTSAQPKLALDRLKDIKIPLPRLSEQERIVAILDDLAAEIKTLEPIYQQKLDALAELKQSILQKAFSGELTKQDIAA